MAADLGASLGGLGSGEAERRLSEYGTNVLVETPRAGLLRLFLKQFSNPLVLILVVAAVVSAVVSQPADSLIIVLVLVSSGVLMATQEYSATTAVERLRSRLHVQCSVVRDGAVRSVPAETVVPGDVVLLSAGALAPADGLVIEARDLFVSQAVLTGESFPAEKRPGKSASHAPLVDRTNVLFMGTSVRSGTGRMLVVRTGRHTEYGSIARGLSLRPPATEFEQGIRRFGYLLTRVVLLLVVVVFGANVFLQRAPIDSLLFAIALAVGISPELLPAIISATLARGARRMAAEGVIVRRLASIESLGSMDVLCCDKTGTLTEGIVGMTSVVGPEGAASARALRIAWINARLQSGIRNPLDDAILAGAPGAGSEEPPEKLDEIPYDFVRRRVTVAVREGDEGVLSVKGAVREVLQLCTAVRREGGTELIDEARRADLLARAAVWSESGHRVLGLATKRVPVREHYAREEERALTFEGFALFQDRAKQGVGAVLRELRETGVAVKIITGDNVHVARHVAREVGLDDRAVLTGNALDETRDEALWSLAERTAVFAEVDPTQKERIILALKKRGHVVGYIGDGINDAPSLHAADVGISVESAVDVARESADLVLLQRDLEVLRRGIVLGRTTFANTIKYIYITTSANFGNMVSMAAASLFLPFLPLRASQILLNNFLSDVPAVALAGDEVDADWLSRPRKWEIAPIRRFMIVFGLVSSAFDFVTFGILLVVFSAGEATFQTGWFVLSLLTELVILFVARTRGPFHRSAPSSGLAWSAAVTGGVALVLPFTRAGRLFEFTPIPASLVGALLAVAVAYGVATEAVKRRFYAGEGGPASSSAARSK
jgi:Mg2+-importing ATPase